MRLNRLMITAFLALSMTILVSAQQGGGGGGQGGGGGGSAGVQSINTVTGAFTFNGTGVSCTSTTYTFSSSGGGDAITSPNSTLGVGGSAGATTLDVLGSAGKILAGATPALTFTPALGVDGTSAGTLQLANGAAAFHTILGSAATANNTVNFFTAVPTNGHLITCTVVSTTCTLTDGGAVPTGTVTSVGLTQTGSVFTITGSPVTTSGSLNLAFAATGMATFLATPSSANLAATITDETGTGALVFGTAPTITLANGTGLPISTGVSGLGTGVATFLGTPTSANLAAALTDETGTGAAVFGTSPTISTGFKLGYITGSTQCLHVDTTGAVTGTGSDCGSGGGAVSSVFTRSGAVVAVSGDYSLDLIAALAASKTWANGNNTLIVNSAQTTASQVATTFGETTAATSTGTPYNVEIKTASGSTSTPLKVDNSLSGSQTLPALSILPTWNTSGVVDAALLINVTNTASGAASLLFDAQVAGTSQFKVDKAGNVTALTSMSVGNPTGGVGSSVFLTQEGTVPSGLSASGQDNCYADSTQHGLLCNFNAAGTLPLVQGPASDTSGHLATWSGTNGGKLVDGGAVPTGTVTSIATTGPITGGTITGTGTIACATCVTSAASLTSTAIMTGVGTQGSQTPDATATLSAGGVLAGVTMAESLLTGSAAATTITETGATNSITRAGVATANLTAPQVIQNTNSSNNNTSITLGVSAPGTSTGQTVLNVNGAATGADLQDWGTGGTWTAGALSGQTIVAAMKISGALALGTATCTTFGTAGGICPLEGTAPTNVSGAAPLYPDSTAHEYMAKTNGSASSGMINRSQPGAIRSTGLVASVGTATLCAASAGACNTGGTYRVHVAMYQGGVACTTNTTGGVSVQLTWTDGNGSAHSAITMPLVTNSSLVALTGTMLFNQTASGIATVFGSGDLTIDTNGTIIQYATTYGNCSVTGTATYAISMVVTRLQ